MHVTLLRFLATNKTLFQSHASRHNLETLNQARCQGQVLKQH